MALRPLLLALAASVALPAAAQAQNFGGGEGLTVYAGPGVLVRPKYQGSDAYEISPIPAFSVTYDDWFFADPARGLGVQRTVTPGVQLSGGLDYVFGREEDDAARLAGLGDLDGGVSGFGAVSIRPFAEGMMRALSLDTRVEAPFTGDIGGAEITTDLVATIPMAGGFVAFSGGASFMTGEMMDDVFGITPAQAGPSIFPAYDPDGGMRAWRFGVTALRPFGDRFVAFAGLGYDKLVEDARRSPIVEERDQFTLAATIMYRFAGQ